MAKNSRSDKERLSPDDKTAIAVNIVKEPVILGMRNLGRLGVFLFLLIFGTILIFAETEWGIWQRTGDKITQHWSDWARYGTIAFAVGLAGTLTTLCARDELSKLKKQFDKNILTQQDYDDAKARVLSVRRSAYAIAFLDWAADQDRTLSVTALQRLRSLAASWPGIGAAGNQPK